MASPKYCRIAWLAFATVAVCVFAAPSSVFGASYGDSFPAFSTFTKNVGPTLADESATDVVVQRDGKVLVGIFNTAERDQRIIRLQANGDLDQSFGEMGSWHKPSTNSIIVRAISLQADGRIVYAGEDATRPGIVIGRLTADGAPDLSFSNDGAFVIATPANSMPQVEDVFVESSGKITFSGIVRNGEHADDLFLGRLTTDGIDDETFSGSPYFLFGSPYPADQDGFGGIAQMPNGDYVVGNPHSATASQVWRINSTGTARIAANVAFFDSFDRPVDVATVDSTHVAVLLEGAHTSGLAFLDVSATPKLIDPSRGTPSLPLNPASFKGHELLRQGDGRIYVSGVDTAENIHRAIIRLDAFGAGDTSWAQQGIKHLSGSSTTRFFMDRHSLSFAPDGSLVSAYHAFAGDIRQSVVEKLVARLGRVRTEITPPLESSITGTPVTFTVRALNDGPDATGRITVRFTVSDSLQIMRWAGALCTGDSSSMVCQTGTIEPSKMKEVFFTVRAMRSGTHNTTASLESDVFDDDLSNNDAAASHTFESKPTAVAAQAIQNNSGSMTHERPLNMIRLWLSRITGYSGRVVKGCATVRNACIVKHFDKAHPLRSRVFLRSTASQRGKRILFLVMQQRYRGQWITRSRPKLPIGANGGLDIKLPTDWTVRTGIWRFRIEAPKGYSTRKPVSRWLFFRVK